jgi:2'-5' RNA ligase
MGYAIVLFFDPASCRRVEELQDGISHPAGLPATGNARPRPHITLALFDALETTDPADKILRNISHSVFPFEIKLESIGWFPTKEGVIFLAPVVTRQLLDVHGHLHRMLDGEGLISVPHYQPGKWVPHCTISTGLTPDSAARTLEAILRSNVFGCVALVEIGLVEFDPIKYLSAFPLVGDHAAAA